MNVKLVDVRSQKDWMIDKLYVQLKKAIDEDKRRAKQNLKTALQTAVKGNADAAPEQSWKRVSVQADKDVDFLSVKKVMFTVTEAGGEEINFAVAKDAVKTN